VDTSKLCASPSSEVNGATGVMIRDQGGLYKQWKKPALGLWVFRFVWATRGGCPFRFTNAAEILPKLSLAPEAIKT